MLDQTATLFPGSRLRMRFAVRSPPRIGLAFPGSRVERSATTAVATVSLIGRQDRTFLRYAMSGGLTLRDGKRSAERVRDGHLLAYLLVYAFI